MLTLLRIHALFSQGRFPTLPELDFTPTKTMYRGTKSRKQRPQRRHVRPQHQPTLPTSLTIQSTPPGPAADLAGPPSRGPNTGLPSSHHPRNIGHRGSPRLPASSKLTTPLTTRNRPTSARKPGQTPAYASAKGRGDPSINPKPPGSNAPQNPGQAALDYPQSHHE